MTSFFSVKNFERFQHYKDRSPPWIKFHNSTLDDYEFGRLPDASKWHLAAIWLLASRYENRIPHDPDWIAKRINAVEPVNLEILEQGGFIVVEQVRSKPLARRKQSSMPERETEAEGEKNSEASASGGEPPPGTLLDLKTELWKRVPGLLTSRGVPVGQERALVGRWLKDLGGGTDAQTALLHILTSAESNCHGEIVEYVTAAIRERKNGRANSNPGTGFDAAVAGARAAIAGGR